MREQSGGSAAANPWCLSPDVAAVSGPVRETHGRGCGKPTGGLGGAPHVAVTACGYNTCNVAEEAEMKVRWTEESVRLRITPSELVALEAGFELWEELRFPGGLSWAVAVEPGAARTDLRTAGDTVALRLTDVDVALLSDGETEGVYFTGGRIRYFVEKDFPCGHPHSHEACEPATERFAPTAGYRARKSLRVPEPV